MNVNKIVEHFEFIGFEVEVKSQTWSAGTVDTTIEILNPFARKHKPGWATLLPEGQKWLISGAPLGRIEVRTYPQDKERRHPRKGYAEYIGWKRQPKRIGYKFTTESEQTLFYNMRRDCPMPSQADFDAACAKFEEFEAKSDDWRRKRELSELGSKYGLRALEVLLESNVEVPEDLKPALEKFLDLSK